MISGQPQVRVLSGGPGGLFNLAGQQQAGGSQPTGQQAPVNPLAFLQQSGLLGGPRPQQGQGQQQQQPQGQGQNAPGNVV